MLIRDCMSYQTRGVFPDTSVRRVVSLMATCDVETLPVVDAERRLLGCVSAHELWKLASSPDDERLDGPIKDVACLEAPSVDADAPLESAASILFEHPWLEALPVLEKAQVVGIVSRHNVLCELSRLATRNTRPSAAPREERGARQVCLPCEGPRGTPGPGQEEGVLDPCVYLG